MNIITILDITIGVLLGNLLYWAILTLRNRGDRWLMERRHAKALAKAKAEADEKLKTIRKGRIVRVGTIETQRSIFGTHQELNGWEWADIEGLEAHGHLADGRCIFYGHTVAELQEIAKRPGEFGGGFTEGTGEEWKGQA